MTNHETGYSPSTPHVTAEHGGAEEDLSRLHYVFAPLSRREPSVDDYYVYLLDPNQAMQGSVEDAAVREGLGELVTDESERDAITQLAITTGIDGDLRGIIDTYMATHGVDIDKIPSALRYDGDLRMQVGSHLLGKVARYLGKMPRRVQVNTEKASHAITHSEKTLSSREVAALYALAQLDGTWIKSREDSLKDRDLGTGGDGLGQHRGAANILLINP